MSERLGVSIHLFLADGSPDGLRIVEKTNWSGVGLVFARADLPAVQARSELSATGVYVLSGPTEDSGFATRVYVGEGDDVLTRLKSHQSSDTKDFWTTTVVFTSKDGNLNKAHARYVESRLVELAREAKRSELANGTFPKPPPLSERDAAEAEGFLREMLVILPVLGLDSFERAADIVSVSAGSSRTRYRFFERGAQGAAEERSEGFVVFEGAKAVLTETPSCPDSIRRLRQSLIDEEVLVRSDDHLRLTQDYVFPSPSNAGGVLCGGSVNGRTQWIGDDGAPLKVHQERSAGLQSRRE